MIRIRRSQKPAAAATYAVQGVTRAGVVGVGIYSTATRKLLGWGVTQTAATMSMQISSAA